MTECYESRHDPYCTLLNATILDLTLIALIAAQPWDRVDLVSAGQLWPVAASLEALEMQAEIALGAPLCRGHSRDALVDGLEIALKGGQMGKADYFGQTRGM